MNIFITGTDTDVGKTVVAAWICKHTGASYWKPIQTGCEFDSDKATVARLSGTTNVLDEVYKLKAPLSPYDAANLEGIQIDKAKLLDRVPDKTVIEGAGGILVPIYESFLMMDLAKMTGSKVLIVARSKLGFLNHILLTAKILEHENIPVIGIVLIGSTDDSTIRTIEAFSKIKVLSVLPIAEDVCELIDQTPLPGEIARVIQ
ncbi:MAG: dethiobiotin synthase [Holosporales bacterium]|jgi:dethiobiotin synthase|nr:dethiobiotin synthase [Holosporales bacterium]